VRVLVARHKPAGLALLADTGECDVVVVDDAFQTVGLAVDRHLVLLDGQKPLGNGFLLPAGRLREPPSALRRADAVLFTRAAGPGPPPGTAWAHLGDRLFVAHESFGGLYTPTGVRVAPESLRGEGVCLISGIGRPQAFESCARAAATQGGFRVRRTVRVGDHAPLEPALRKLLGRLEALECSRVLTTAKDLARLPAGSKWDEPLLVVEQRLVIPDRVRLLEVLVGG
jgi:tetraacyldisaccharide 4'-kinase